MFSSLGQGNKVMGHLFTYCRPTKAADRVRHLELNALPPTAVTLYGVSGSVNLGNNSSLKFPKFVILRGRSSLWVLLIFKDKREVFANLVI